METSHPKIECRAYDYAGQCEHVYFPKGRENKTYMKYFSISQPKKIGGEDWVVVSWDKGSFGPEIFSVMMGSIHGNLGKDCYYSRKQKKFFVKSSAVELLDSVVSGFDDDFSPNVRDEFEEEIDGARW